MRDACANLFDSTVLNRRSVSCTHSLDAIRMSQTEADEWSKQKGTTPQDGSAPTQRRRRQARGDGITAARSGAAERTVHGPQARGGYARSIAPPPHRQAQDDASHRRESGRRAGRAAGCRAGLARHRRLRDLDGRGGGTARHGIRASLPHRTAPLARGRTARLPARAGRQRNIITLRSEILTP